MTHIPAHLVLPQDMVAIFDHGPPRPQLVLPALPENHDEAQLKAHEEKLAAHEAALDDWHKKWVRPVRLTMHVTDAKAAMESEPKRYRLSADEMVHVYDIGAPTLMTKDAAERLVASDRHRYMIKPTEQTDG